MAELTTQHTFDGAIGDVYQGIRQYAQYKDYLPGVTGIDVLPAKKKGSTCQVRYELKFIKSFYYTLNMFEEEPTRIWWDLDDSNIMKQSVGSWLFKDLGDNKTHATYALDIAFSGLVPQRIVDQITKANLPLMMKGFQKLIIETSDKS